MKIVVWSDAHGDRVTAGFERFDDVETAMLEVEDAAIREKADYVAFCGDLADPDSGPRTLRTVARMIGMERRLYIHSISTVVIPGNHDVFEDGSGESVLSSLEGGTALVFARPAVHRCAADPNVRFVFLPFAASSHPYDADAFLRGLPDHKGKTVVFSHLTGLAGALIGDETTEMARGREATFPLAACADKGWTILQGHYHRRQIVEAPGGVKVHVVGSLARLSFGAEERNTPGFLVVEV